MSKKLLASQRSGGSDLVIVTTGIFDSEIFFINISSSLSHGQVGSIPPVTILTALTPSLLRAVLWELLAQPGASVSLLNPLLKGQSGRTGVGPAACPQKAWDVPGTVPVSPMPGGGGHTAELRVSVTLTCGHLLLLTYPQRHDLVRDQEEKQMEIGNDV